MASTQLMREILLQIFLQMQQMAASALKA